MIVFINGSINSGKTTIGRLLAEEMNAEFIEFDDIRSEIADIELERAIPIVIDTGINRINRLLDAGKSVVAAYPLNLSQANEIKNRLNDKVTFINLKPNIEDALSKRGERKLTDWEMKRIQHHYDVGIPDMELGIIINNSNQSPSQTVEEILRVLHQE